MEEGLLTSAGWKWKCEMVKDVHASGKSCHARSCCYRAHRFCPSPIDSAYCSTNSGRFRDVNGLEKKRFPRNLHQHRALSLYFHTTIGLFLSDRRSADFVKLVTGRRAFEFSNPNTSGMREKSNREYSISILWRYHQGTTAT